MPTITFTTGLPTIGYQRGSPSQGDTVALSSRKKDFSSSHAYKGTHLTYTLTRPAGIPWAVCEITNIYITPIGVRDSGSSVKDASWLFRTTAGGDLWNTNTASINGAAVWLRFGITTPSRWHSGGTNKDYSININVDTVNSEGENGGANAIAWCNQEYKAGRNIYFSLVEARSAADGATYTTRFVYQPITVTITYTLKSSVKYHTGNNNWQTCIPYRYISASSINQTPVTRPNGAMTAATSKDCTASSSSNYSTDFPAWRAFDDSVTTNTWASQRGVTSAWLLLKMPEKLYDITVTLTNRQDHATLSNGPISGTIQGSNDGTNFTNIKSFSGRDGKTKGASSSIACGNTTTGYQWIRIYTENWDKTSDTSKTECCIGDCSISGYLYPTAGNYWRQCIIKRWDGSDWVQV